MPQVRIGATNCCFDIDPGVTLWEVKQSVAQTTGLAPSNVVLLYEGREVQDENVTVAGLGVVEMGTVVAARRGMGEMVVQLVPRCCINSFDNVRVLRGMMTLRCRGCDKKIRAPAAVAGKWRCSAYWRKGTCQAGLSCPSMHVHFRKKNLTDRVQEHGTKALAPTLNGRGRGTLPSSSALAQSCPSSVSESSDNCVLRCATPPSPASSSGFRYDPYSENFLVLL